MKRNTHRKNKPLTQVDCNRMGWLSKQQPSIDDHPKKPSVSGSSATEHVSARLRDSSTNTKLQLLSVVEEIQNIVSETSEQILHPNQIIRCDTLIPATDYDLQRSKKSSLNQTQQLRPSRPSDLNEGFRQLATSCIGSADLQESNECIYNN